MSYCNRRRGGVTRVELLVVMTIIVVFLTALIPVILAAREASNRTACAQNLRQLGLVVHNYHDINGALPPLYSRAFSDSGAFTYEDAPSWAVFLLPYMEHRAAWEELVINQSVTNNTITAAGGGGRTNLKNLSAMRTSAFNCPTRGRRTVTLAGEMWQTSDYVPLFTSNVTNSAGELVVWDGRKKNWTGMIAPPLSSAPTSSGLISRTTFNSVTDGLSFTAMFGEKHMGRDWLGSRSLDYPVLPFQADYRSIRTTGLALTKTLREGSDGASTVPARMQFGSWHPGYTTFCFGDTSIKLVKNYTSVTALKRMTGRADALPYDLP